MKFIQLLLVACFVPVLLSLPLVAAGQQPTVLPSDCVKIRYIQGLWLNPSGSRVAYLVKSPNLEENRNDYNLYARDSAVETRSQGLLLLTANDVASVMWVQRGESLAALATIGRKRQVVVVNASTAKPITSVPVPPSTDSFSIDEAGATIAYSVLNQAAPQNRNANMDAEGYRVTYGEQVDSMRPTHSFYVTRRVSEKHWSKPELLSIRNPITHVDETSVIVNSHFTLISLSPDGKQLLFQYMTATLPERWHENSIVRMVAVQNTLFEILVRYDLETKQTILAFNSISVSSVPVWSRDSKTFFINAYSPMDSKWEAEDVRDHLAIPTSANLFSVNIATGDIEEIARHIDYYHESPNLDEDGEGLEVQVSSSVIARARREKGYWHEVTRQAIPISDGQRVSAITSNGLATFLVAESVASPPDIYEYKAELHGMRVLTDINPEVHSLRLATTKQIHWRVDGRYDVAGLLFLPPDYIPGKRYPLVIQTKRESGWFACDSGSSHYPSFAPQPIATSGILYLAPLDNGAPNDPSGVGPSYPGGVSEAVRQMNMWDGAVESLAQEGMIDPSKVGIIGFSRTGFYVDFDISHGKTHYAAATASDNVEYSLAEYWLVPYVSHAEVAMFGGPPFGSTLRNWEHFSISYNLDKITTPLLMEQMGYGVKNDDPNKLPVLLACSLEVYMGLKLRGKPVEMYYYPNEDHQPDNPAARLASLERNLDWYRFWLQDYEDRSSAKVDQYARWRHLREQSSTSWSR